MSPFALVLKHFRQKRGLKQKDLALLLGYEPSYLSALERSEKGPPKQDFIRRLISGLSLSEDERAEPDRALKLSRRQVSLPATASEQEYGLLHELAPHLGHLHPLQIHLIKLALRLPRSLCNSEAGIGADYWCPQSERKEAPKM